MQDTITTHRLTLRRVHPSDAPAMSRWAGDYDVASMTGSITAPLPLLAAEIRCVLFKLHWENQREYAYAITLGPHNKRVPGGCDGVAQDEMIGIASLFKRKIEGEYELGYWIAKPFWGQGYISEACRAVLTTVPTSLGVTSVKAGVYCDNPGSIRVLNKLGFTATGTKQEYFCAARGQKVMCLDFVAALPVNSETGTRLRDAPHVLTQVKQKTRTVRQAQDKHTDIRPETA